MPFELKTIRFVSCIGIWQPMQSLATWWSRFGNIAVSGLWQLKQCCANCERIMLDTMYIVTSKTGHRRGLETATLFQHLHLASMNIKFRARRQFHQRQVFAKRLTRRV